jgi:hypothetical protein
MKISFKRSAFLVDVFHSLTQSSQENVMSVFGSAEAFRTLSVYVYYMQLQQDHQNAKQQIKKTTHCNF